MHVSIYPNPVSDVLNIRGNTTELSIVIYDILGKQIMRSRILNSIDISSLNNGIYLIEFSDGKHTTTRKLIRKIDIQSYRANTTLCKKTIKWESKITFKKIVHKMINNELH